MLRMHRLNQPRSNRTTNLLFGITFVVFTLVAEAAMDQQQEARAVAGQTPVSDQGAPSHPLVLAWRVSELIPRLQF